MVLFHYLCSIVSLSLELLVLLSAAQGSDKHIIVFTTLQPPRIFEVFFFSIFILMGIMEL